MSQNKRLRVPNHTGYGPALFGGLFRCGLGGVRVDYVGGRRGI